MAAQQQQPPQQQPPAPAPPDLQRQAPQQSWMPGSNGQPIYPKFEGPVNAGIPKLASGGVKASPLSRKTGAVTGRLGARPMVCCSAGGPTMCLGSSRCNGLRPNRVTLAKMQKMTEIAVLAMAGMKVALPSCSTASSMRRRSSASAMRRRNGSRHPATSGCGPINDRSSCSFSMPVGADLKRGGHFGGGGIASSPVAGRRGGGWELPLGPLVHHRGVGDVAPHLHHAGRHQHLHLTGFEGPLGLGAFSRRRSA